MKDSIPSSLLSLLLFTVFLLLDFVAPAAAFNPADSYYIACGSSKNITVENQIFIPDTFNLRSSGGDSVVSSNHSLSSPIHQSLRVFTQTGFYRFRIKRPGRHWVRLHFYPLSKTGHDLNSAPLTVLTDEFVLLHNFSFANSNLSYMTREFSVNVTSDTLSLAFIPSNGSVSFINGIEVVSIPDELISDSAMAVPHGPYSGLSTVGLETVYRLNMGGSMLTAKNDTLGRRWDTDVKYLHVNSSVLQKSVDPEIVNYPVDLTKEIAPSWVYSTANVMNDANVTDSTFNMTWVFSVDPAFSYLLRLHFCDIFSKTMDTLVFDVYVNSDLAIPSLDLSAMKSQLSVPYYKDFVANSSFGSNYLSVSVGPDLMADTKNAILNGLEIMKISNGRRSLDGLSSVDNLLPSSANSVNKEEKKNMVVVIGLVAGILGVAVLILIGCFFFFQVIYRRRKLHRPWLPLPLYGNSHTDSKIATGTQKSVTPSLISLASAHHGRIFTFAEIMDSTNKFDEKLVLGVGGFGKVYKGTLDDGTLVAVKRGNPRSEQGLAEFHTEIEMLSKLRHRHLVSLIGYCDERSEMILVYEYMANGPLRSHLYGAGLPPLSWKQRLEICIGSAKGLHYLHTGATQSIIHRDVKTTNILLDENFVAKVADFGLSKTGPSLDQTHVSTIVKGSFGYLDPEYFRRQQLTEKSDVYSFGVVMMEVLCSRPALNPGLPREQANIAEWALEWQKKGMLEQKMDPALIGNTNPASLKKYGDMAEKCLAERGVDRPSMYDVLWNLEYALQLQETCALVDPDENSTNHISAIQLTPLESLENSMAVDESAGINSGTDEDAGETTTSAVFSQLVHPRGR
ncbi:Receptor-like protein kinase THESEUS 1 [Zostera marina]|uniref:Receptor-like protein kinase THESEUS 1 n=1 Tax=Zostera marina TaxID=29655 RepID=A0A0K9P7W5_ZOSMR|nr:Receptor-like protein kinase THESEUS 1 [Zostera marina]